MRDSECEAWATVAPTTSDDPMGAVQGSARAARGGYAVVGSRLAYESDGLDDIVLHDPLGLRERNVAPHPTTGMGFIASNGTHLVRSALDCNDSGCDSLILLHDLERCLSMELLRIPADDLRAYFGSAQLVHGRLYFIESLGNDGVAIELELATGSRREFRAASVSQSWLIRAGDGWVAMLEDRREGHQLDLRVVQVATGESRWVTDSAGIEWDPRIADGILYWSDSRAGLTTASSEDEHDIYAYDLATGTTRAVVTSRGSQMLADARGEELLWLDFRDGYWFPENRGGVVDIYSGNARTGEQRKLTNAPRLRWSAHFFGDRFAWMQAEAPPGSPYDDRLWHAPLPASPP